MKNILKRLFNLFVNILESKKSLAERELQRALNDGAFVNITMKSDEPCDNAKIIGLENGQVKFRYEFDRSDEDESAMLAIAEKTCNINQIYEVMRITVVGESPLRDVGGDYEFLDIMEE